MKRLAILASLFAASAFAGTGTATTTFETQLQTNPPTVVGLRYTLLKADGTFVAFKDTALDEAPSFTGLADGDYKVQVQRRTATALLAPIVTSEVRTLDSRVPVQVPVSVTLTLTP